MVRNGSPNKAQAEYVERADGAVNHKYLEVIAAEQFRETGSLKFMKSYVCEYSFRDAWDLT